MLRYFFGYAFRLWMKRWRYPEYGAVHCARPKEFLPGMQYPENLQRCSLQTKISGKPFLNFLPRQVQQYWKKRFFLFCREQSNWPDQALCFKQAVAAGQLPMSKRRIYSTSWEKANSPYLPFVLTVKPRHISPE